MVIALQVNEKQLATFEANLKTLFLHYEIFRVKSNLSNGINPLSKPPEVH